MEWAADGPLRVFRCPDDHVEPAWIGRNLLRPGSTRRAPVVRSDATGSHRRRRGEREHGRLVLTGCGRRSDVDARIPGLIKASISELPADLAACERDRRCPRPLRGRAEVLSGEVRLDDDGIGRGGRARSEECCEYCKDDERVLGHGEVRFSDLYASRVKAAPKPHVRRVGDMQDHSIVGWASVQECPPKRVWWDELGCLL